MNKRQLTTFAFMIIIFIFSFPIFSSAEEDENSLFNVTVIPNELQKKTDSSFFDLLVEPNDQTKLNLLVTNTGREKKKIIISPTNATTNRNGEVDYSEINKNEIRDSSLKIALTDLIEEKKIVDLEPGETKKVEFNLKIPSEEFDGIILGAFVVYVSEDISTEEDGNNDSGMVIKNKFEIRKVIQIQEKQTIPIPQLKINDIGFNWIDNTPALTVNIQNTKPTLFGEISIKATVREKNKKKLVKEYSVSNFEMAPNSNFDFPIFWYNQEIVEGNYWLNLDISSGSQKWELEKDFSISKKDSTKFNNFYQEKKKEKLIWIDYLVASLFFLIFLVLAYVSFFLIKNKKGQFSLKRNIDNFFKNNKSGKTREKKKKRK